MENTAGQNIIWVIICSSQTPSLLWLGVVPSSSPSSVLQRLKDRVLPPWWAEAAAVGNPSGGGEAFPEKEVNLHLNKTLLYQQIRQQMEEQVAQKSSELEQYLQRVRELEDMYLKLQEALEDERQARQDEETVRKLQARC